MTLHETMAKRLRNHGMWPDEIETVLKETKLAISPMSERWDDNAERYPTSFMAILWLEVKRRAIDYLKTNKPMHSALALLEGKE